MPYLVIKVGKLGNWLSGLYDEYESRKKAVAEAKRMNEYFSEGVVYIVTYIDEYDDESLEWAPEKYYELRKQLKYRQNPMSDSMDSIRTQWRESPRKALHGAIEHVLWIGDIPIARLYKTPEWDTFAVQLLGGPRSDGYPFQDIGEASTAEIGKRKAAKEIRDIIIVAMNR